MSLNPRMTTVAVGGGVDRAAEALISALLPVAERAVNALERWLDAAEIGIDDDQPVMVTHKRPDQTWEEAVTEAEQKADGVKTPRVPPQLIEAMARIDSRELPQVLFPRLMLRECRTSVLRLMLNS